jgi:hypothetical protein
MRLPFDADQAIFDEWREFWMAKVNDPEDDFMHVDLNDMIVVFSTARVLVTRHPDKADAFIEHTPTYVERAGKDLGIFMGMTALAQAVGIDPEEAREAVFTVMK